MALGEVAFFARVLGVALRLAVGALSVGTAGVDGCQGRWHKRRFPWWCSRR